MYSEVEICCTYETYNVINQCYHNKKFKKKNCWVSKMGRVSDWDICGVSVLLSMLLTEIGNVGKNRDGHWEKGKGWVQVQMMSLLCRQEICVHSSCKQLNIFVWRLGQPSLEK